MYNIFSDKIFKKFFYYYYYYYYYYNYKVYLINKKMQKENENINSKILENNFQKRPIAKILFHSKRKESNHSNDSKFSSFTNYSNEITGKFDEDLDSLSDISSFEL